MAKNSNGGTRDINDMTDAEIAEFQKQRKLQQAKLVAEKGQQAKKELEAYCLKTYGLTLQQVFLSGKEVKLPKTYRNPADGMDYTYSGKGKVPVWLQTGGNGKDAKKPNPAYEVKSN